MSRKPKKGYFVRGQFVAEGSELDLEFKRELKGGLDGPSRTELKRESTELQELGTALLTLRRDLMERLALPDKLVDGLAEAKRITNFEGKRRQMQFIGKQMRLLSPETLQAVREALDIQRLGSAKDTQALHLAEAWRDRLIADDAAVGEWIEHHPQTDIQQLRALVRQARKDAVPVTNAAVSQGLAPRQGRAYRELFKLVRSVLTGGESDNTPDEEAEDDDRASTGVYEDKGLPALQDWLTRALHNPITFEPRLIPDEKDRISATLIELVDAGCSLVLTTGGTGPALRDVTPEATLAVADKEMPGFGEQMRQISLKFVPTAILSRQVAVIRSQSLIINLPGQPKSIAETLEGLKDAEGKAVVHGIFAAVPYCVDLIGGPYMETKDEVCKAFRPKTAIRPAR
eukprot:gene22310-27272_t